MALSIDYKLTGSGWAECTIADGERSCIITASYLRDAFGDLVLSAIAMLHWFNATSFSFEEEPGEFRWDLETQPNNTLDLKISEAYLDHAVPPPEWKHRTLFETTTTQMNFGRAVAKAANALLEEYGEDRYLEKWVEYPFPTDSFRELNRLLEKFSEVPWLNDEEA